MHFPLRLFTEMASGFNFNEFYAAAISTEACLNAIEKLKEEEADAVEKHRRALQKAGRQQGLAGGRQS